MEKQEKKSKLKHTIGEGGGEQRERGNGEANEEEQTKTYTRKGCKEREA